jgi:hypothetical protein
MEKTKTETWENKIKILLIQKIKISPDKFLLIQNQPTSYRT